MWSVADIADAIEIGLRRHAAQLDLEQSISGLDALDEVALHPVLAEALAEAGYGVHREQRYPTARRRRRESEGERCDLVLTPDGRKLRQPDAKATLFDDPDAVELDEAFWLEVKVVAQFTREGSNRNYSSQLLSTVRQDIAKLSKEYGILHAGLLIVLHTADAIVSEHDLGVWQDRCLERGLPVAAPTLRELPITDRLGNGVCTLALYPVRRL